MGQSHTKQSAFSLVEILIAIAMFAIFSTSIVYLSLDTVDRDSKTQLDNEALLYAQEGIEAMRNMRDRDYLSLANGDHGLQLSGDEWAFIAAPEDIDGLFERIITIEDVYRDVNNDIAETGTFDPDTKKVISQVDWLWRGTLDRSIELTTYLSNWTGDDWIQTTCTEFTAGTFTDSEILASNPPPADNCLILLSAIGEASEFFASADIGDHGNDVDVDGNYAYVAAKKSSKGLTIVDVSDPANPFVESTEDVGEKAGYITKDGNYAYIGVRTSEGLAIADVSNPSNPETIAILDIDNEGHQIVISGNVLFMGVDDDDMSFISVDISDKENPEYLDILDLDDETLAAHISGNYIYAGVDDDSNGLRVIDISDPEDLREVGSLDVGEEVNAIEISGAVAYVGSEEKESSLQVVNISTPTSPALVTSIDVGGEIQDLVMFGDYLYAAIDEQNSGLAVIDISNPLAPSLEYNLDVKGKATGIDTDGDYIYISTDTSNKGLVIVGAQAGGVATSGTYISTTLDTGSEETRYNFIEWDHTEVPGGAVRFQIRTASSAGGLSSATWIGYDGTNSTYYENSRTEIELDPYRSGKRYFQFKAFLESDGATSPSIESVRINYNP